MSTREPLDPQREILAKRHRKSNPFAQIHRYTSLKTNDRLSGESHNERDHWLWLDACPNIRAILTELESVVVGRYRYTPDTAALTDDNQLINYEMKSVRTAQDPKFIKRFDEKILFYAEQGQTLKLVTRNDFPSERYIANLKLMYMYVTGEPPPQDEQVSLSHFLPPLKEDTFGNLCVRLAEKLMTPHAIWYGLAKGHYTTDLNKRITDYSLIKRTRKCN